MRESKGLLLVYAAALIWSTIGPAARLAYERGASSWELVLGRFTVVSAIGAVLLAMRLVRFNGVARPGVLVVGASLGAPFVAAYLAAIEYLGVARAVTLLYTAPVWVWIYNTLIYRLWSARGLSASLLAFLGVYLLYSAGAGSYGELLGWIYGLASGALYGAFIVATERLMHTGSDPMEVVLGTHMGGLPIVVAICLALGYTISGPAGLLVGVYFGLGPGILAFLLFNMGLRIAGSVASSVAATLEPLAGVLWGVILLGEHLGLTGYLGVSLIISSQVIISRG